jgi:hypothetical protein
MPMIVVQESGQPARLFEVRSTTVRIGRGADCELLLPNISVSRSHAILEDFDGTTARLNPLSKKNPLRFRDVDLTGPVIIDHNESFRVGKFRLTWLHEKALDGYKLHELAEMPRFVRVQRQVQEETFSMSPDLRRKLEEYDQLRKHGGLVGDSGDAWKLGTTVTEIGPNATIPCASRLGRWTAAKIAWAGNGHQITRVGLFATVTVNGESVSDERVLERDQTVTINGTSFQYRLLSRGR